jgi:hypothetical protein
MFNSGHQIEVNMAAELPGIMTYLMRPRFLEFQIIKADRISEVIMVQEHFDTALIQVIGGLQRIHKDNGTLK